MQNALADEIKMLTSMTIPVLLKSKPVALKSTVSASSPKHAKITLHYDLFVHHVNQISQPGNVNWFLFLLCRLGQQTSATNMIARVKVT